LKSVARRAQHQAGIRAGCSVMDSTSAEYGSDN
jgi:hypothetical protein